MPSQKQKYDYLYDEYYSHFGFVIGIPFGAILSEAEMIEEMTYSLETGIPFDKDSPRWRWHDEVPDYVVI